METRRKGVRSTSYPCVSCTGEVGERQEALSCDKCKLWTHRVCQQVVSRKDYFLMKAGEIPVSFICYACKARQLVNGSESIVETPKSPREDADMQSVRTEQTSKDTLLSSDLHQSILESSTAGENNEMHSMIVEDRAQPADTTAEDPSPSSDCNISISDYSAAGENNEMDTNELVSQLLDDEVNHRLMAASAAAVFDDRQGTTISDSFFDNLVVNGGMCSSTRPSMDNAANDDGGNFNIELPFGEPLPATEQSIEGGQPPVGVVLNKEEEFQIVKKGGERGHDLLVSTWGYSFGRQSKTKSGAVTWRCTHRRPGDVCPVRIKQQDDNFNPNNRTHNHQPRDGHLLNIKVRKEAKRMGIKQLTKGAGTIVDNIVRKELAKREKEGETDLLVPDKENVKRVVNQYRQSRRPPHPTHLNFELQHYHIPSDFLVGDVTSGNNRSIVLATPKQLELLSKSKQWFVDGTFKLARAPFTQLYSFHAFIKKDKNMVQVPLAFAIMSGKSCADYKEVIETILQALPTQPQVTHVVADFEAGMWRALRELIPGVNIRGCSFHWGQAVMRKIQELGLRPVYSGNHQAGELLRMIMALQYLPEEHISPTLTILSDKWGETAYAQLCKYVSDTWLSQWIPSDWAQYKNMIRSNNHVEGWHNKVNSRYATGHTAPDLYTLIHYMYEEASTIPTTIQLLSRNKLNKRAKKGNDAVLFELWELYEKKEITTKELLEKAARCVKVTT